MSEAFVVAKQNETPPPDVSFLHRLQYRALLGIVALARFVPVALVRGSGAGIAWTIGPWLRQNRRALANLAVAFPEKSETDRRRIARAMWANMGRTFAETLVFDRIIADSDTVEVIDEAKWEASYREAGPAINATLHLGSWELAGWPLLKFGRKAAGVYKPLANPLANRWLIERRQPLFLGGLIGKGGTDGDPREGQRMVRRMIDVVRKGGTLGFGADHFDRRGEPIAFMGARARFTTAPAMIACHVKARFYVGCCVRIGRASRFRMELRQLDVPQTGDRAQDAITLTTEMFKVFEEWIRAHPEQWMWWNTRWVKDDGTTMGKADRQ